jgi:hypothetical protein
VAQECGCESRIVIGQEVRKPAESNDFEVTQDVDQDDGGSLAAVGKSRQNALEYSVKLAW